MGKVARSRRLQHADDLALVLVPEDGDVGGAQGELAECGLHLWGAQALGAEAQQGAARALVLGLVVEAQDGVDHRAGERRALERRRLGRAADGEAAAGKLGSHDAKLRLRVAMASVLIPGCARIGRRLSCDTKRPDGCSSWRGCWQARPRA